MDQTNKWITLKDAGTNTIYTFILTAILSLHNLAQRKRWFNLNKAVVIDILD